MRGLGRGLGLTNKLSGSEIVASFSDFLSWGPTNVSITSDDFSDSVGGTDGDTIADNATAGFHSFGRSSIAAIPGQEYTFEVTLAPANLTTAYIGISDGVVHSAHINLSTGGVGATSNVIGVTSSNVGLLNGYWKFSFRWVAGPSGNINVSIYLTDAGVLSYAGTGLPSIRIHTAVITKP